MLTRNGSGDWVVTEFDFSDFSDFSDTQIVTHFFYLIPNVDDSNSMHIQIVNTKFGSAISNSGSNSVTLKL